MSRCGSAVGVISPFLLRCPARAGFAAFEVADGLLVPAHNLGELLVVQPCLSFQAHRKGHQFQVIWARWLWDASTHCVGSVNEFGGAV